MKKPIYLLFAFLALMHFVRAQTSYFFIGELRLGYGKYLDYGYDHDIPHKLFIQNYDLKLFIDNGNGTKLDSLRSHLMAKEDWYSNPEFKEEVKKVEVIIEVPQKYITFKNKGKIDLIGELRSKTHKDFVAPVKGTITAAWEPGTTYSLIYINSNTFKLQSPIVISAPASVGLDLGSAFLKTTLDSISDETPQFKHIVEDLDTIGNKYADHVILSFSQFMDFSRLLIFLQPYTIENSFLNQEAKELSFYLKELKAGLNFLSQGSKQEDSVQKVRGVQIEWIQKMLTDYDSLLKRVKNLNNKLQVLLYSNRYTYNYPNNLTASPSILDTYKIPSAAGSNNQFHIGIGASVLFSQNKLFNVTLARGAFADTVKFETLSRVQNILSAGAYWSPLKKTTPGKPFRNNSTGVEENFSLGILLTYTLLPSNSQLPGSMPLGIGFSTGYTFSYFGLYGTVNFKSNRQPRQYFIDKYSAGTSPFGNLDINDGSIFVNKLQVAYGITITYFFNNRSVLNNSK